MTIVEFFDKTPLENIAGAMLLKPRKVIYVGDKRKRIEKGIRAYKRVMAQRGIDVIMTYSIASRNSIDDIVDTLEHIVASNPDAVFDITGGEDLYLAAVGIMMERHKGEIQCHRFNLKNSVLIDCDADGNVYEVESFDISAEENIILHGAEIVRESEESDFGTYDWDFNDEFCLDIEKMWTICRNDSRLWNAHVGTLRTVNELYSFQDSMTVSFNKAEAQEEVRRRGIKYVFITGIMKALEENGLISKLIIGDEISFTYKNSQIKRALTLAGQILELFVAKRIIHVEDDGIPLYHDTRVGLIVNWDAAEDEERVKTVNEIDVLTMKDSIPVFISCKNGVFDVDELYKLETVGNYFGAEYAKKVLVTGDLNRMGPRAEHIRRRAADMNIRLIENVDEITDEDFDRMLRSLWLN